MEIVELVLCGIGEIVWLGFMIWLGVKNIYLEKKPSKGDFLIIFINLMVMALCNFVINPLIMLW